MASADLKDLKRLWEGLGFVLWLVEEEGFRTPRWRGAERTAH